MARRFPAEILDEVDRAKILGVRSGDEHSYTGVWPVVVDGQVFARSWNDQPTCWFRAFCADREGSMQVGMREIAIRGVRTRKERMRAAVTEAFARKYDTKGTKGSRHWIEGFRERERNTLELVPREEG